MRNGVAPHAIIGSVAPPVATHESIPFLCSGRVSLCNPGLSMILSSGALALTGASLLSAATMPVGIDPKALSSPSVHSRSALPRMHSMVLEVIAIWLTWFRAAAEGTPIFVHQASESGFHIPCSVYAPPTVLSERES